LFLAFSPSYLPKSGLYDSFSARNLALQRLDLGVMPYAYASLTNEKMSVVCHFTYNFT